MAEREVGDAVTAMRVGRDAGNGSGSMGTDDIGRLNDAVSTDTSNKETVASLESTAASLLRAALVVGNEETVAFVESVARLLRGREHGH